ncbi:MAG: zeta toxin family protein [Ferruginibacter sp.]
MMLQKINDFIENKQSFAFETTLSGNNYFDIITSAKEIGFTVTLFFVYLESFELAIERVALRVLKGGHNIPDDVIERRYFKGLKNINKYIAIADDWYILDNSKINYKFVAKSLNKKDEIINLELFNFIYNYGK